MFLPKALLKEANDAAHREKRSRCIDPKLVNNIPNEFDCFIKNKFYHKKNEIRLEVEIDVNGTTKFLDISITRYLTLPTRKYLDNEVFEDIYPERPYLNEREWQEVEIKKPLRKQTKFRREVLSSYNFTCAICSINEKNLLRAAHILGVAEGGIDTINNGITLCVNHEIAFDQGKIKILPNYEVVAPSGIGVEVSKLKLPSNNSDYPSPENLLLKLKLLMKVINI